MNTPELRRLYPDYTYSRDVIASCFWADAVPAAALEHPPVSGPQRTRVAVIGAGYTGLNATLALAQAGVDVTLLDAEFPGFGASGRNGGFCCLGSHRASDLMLRRFGPDAPAQVRRAEAAAIAHVDALLTTHDIDVDRHSTGEVILAHSEKAMQALRRKAPHFARDFGADATLIEKSDLAAHGLSGPNWHGALQTPLGFALHPRKYLAGLVRAATAAGARIHGQSPVLSVQKTGATFTLITPAAVIEADRVIFATNGYTAENLIPWLRGRILPAQSSVIATRPMSDDELAAQGFTSRQMSYEDRRLLHYFHLTPDGRMVFGQRGGLLSSPRNEARVTAGVRADFDAAFPAWRHVETPFHWSGMVCLTASLTPYCGPVPGLEGAYAGFGYHGNGVAMASYTGTILADLAQDRPSRYLLPTAFAAPPPRFPLGRFRRAILASEYTMARLLER
ncbi:FAD-binding oxidoreductase [Pseudooceanicola sediminis]|uniref:FAD-binding oxidoreductase n=1 Tax=Pseudooceanicola sediminis TaxID=2211117 RepID=A0A399IZE4_9RHOB|nr:FAD-dependent oxidoreductase [Pseudooceanicola sediminis]KAA2313316.1 FAD-binding oxidoreductase [Puniceibacterium sp. HSS470]RII38401.1 FAD-binding oxidoreductase [Pseudooceanicola sediminis]